MPPQDTGSLLILKALLEAKKGFVSGNALAKKLGVSRVSVWGRMEQLRDQGFEFEAVTRKGYRLVRKPDSLHPLLTRAYLSNPAQCPELVFLSTIDSTNDHASRLLANAYETPFFVLTNQQSRGRGRMGRQWHSPPSCNLYLSVASRPMLSPHRMQLFTLWMGICVARHLRQRLSLEFGLKWPNDLYYQGKKVGGMLTEARMDSDSIRELVFGIGLNVNQEAGSWPKDLIRTAVSLRELTGQELDLNETAALLVESIQESYATFIDEEIKELFETLWPEFDILRGRTVEAEYQGKTIQGTASGLDDRGSLILKYQKGKVLALNSGDVRIVHW